MTYPPYPPFIVPLDPADEGEQPQDQQKIIGLLTPKTIGTGSTRSPGVSGGAYEVVGGPS